MSITREIQVMGGKARAEKISAERRKQIAAMGGRRTQEINKANKRALETLNAKVEGHK